jgi:hypothetical protein
MHFHLLLLPPLTQSRTAICGENLIAPAGDLV